MRSKLLEVYDRLYRHFGPQHWWPAETWFEVIIGAILTQSISWTGVEKAMASLKSAGALDPAELRRLSLPELAKLIYPAGYYNAKARKIKAFVQHLGERHADDLDRLFSQETPALRQELLSIYGIGEETADSIILYAACKPVFVIDAYTRRVVSRLGLAPAEDSYGAYQRLFADKLPSDTQLFNEYHALLVAQGKHVCRKVPLCERCPLKTVCEYGRGRV
ncbi:MAG: endonuclease III domain-containing protein [Dehalococcoidia bacterium]